jgi:hypothetical protein
VTVWPGPALSRPPPYRALERGTYLSHCFSLSVARPGFVHPLHHLRGRHSLAHSHWFIPRTTVLCTVRQSSTAMSTTGTYRGTPKNRNQVQYANSPSAIPRPALDQHVSHTSNAAQSDVGTSLSASRAKMSKRDEVSASGAPAIYLGRTYPYIM